MYRFQYNYNNFIVGEPNNYMGLESCVTVSLSYLKNSLKNRFLFFKENISFHFQMSTDITMILSVVYPRGTWNDVPCTDPFDYFVCKAPKL